MTPVIAGSITCREPQGRTNRTPTGPHRRCDMFKNTALSCFAKNIAKNIDRFDSNKVKNTGGTFTFTVDDVTRSGWTYDFVETSGSITVP